MMYKDARRGTTSQRWLVGLTLLLLAVSALAVIGCSDDGGDADATTTTGIPGVTTPVTGLEKPEDTPTSVTVGPNTPGESTGTSIIQTIPVGGKTQEEYEAAVKDLTAKADAAPNDLGTLQELAIAQYQTKRYTEAIETYKKMLAIKDEPTVRNNMANVLRDSGDVAQATAEYEKAIATDPTLLVAYVNLAALQFSQDKPDEAYQTLDTGIAKTTGDDQQRLKDIKTQYKENVTTTT